MIPETIPPSYMKELGKLNAASCVVLSDALTAVNQVFCSNSISGELSAANLSVRYVTADEFHGLLGGETSASFEPKTLYVVSSDQLNAYNERILSVADPEENADAANKSYVDAGLQSKLAYSDLSLSYADQHIYLSAQGREVGDIDCADFIKDGMLSNVELCGNQMVFWFNMEDGPASNPISVNLSSFFDQTQYFTREGVSALLSVKLDSEAAYPAWDSTKGQSDYKDGDIVSYNGRLYRVISHDIITNGIPPPEQLRSAWEEVFLKDLKQDKLNETQLSAANSGITSSKVEIYDATTTQLAEKRDLTDMCVRGLPEGVGSWFVWRNTEFQFDVEHEEWTDHVYSPTYRIRKIGTNDYEIINSASETLWTFTFGQNYSTSVDGDIIIGYVDTLATERWVEGKDYATTAQLAEKRGVLDMSVRGAPTGAGSFFTVNQNGTVYTYTYANEIWSASETMAIRIESGEYIQYNPEMGDDHFSFTLTPENNYSYTDTDYGFVVVGYTDTLVTENWVEGKNYLSSIPSSYAQLSDTSKVFIKDSSESGYEDGKQSDLSVIKLTNEEYAVILSNDEAQPNALYVVSDDFIDGYGQQVKNIAYGELSSDAAAFGQLQAVSSDISSKQDKLTGEALHAIDPSITLFKIQTTDYYRKTGIYSAERNDTSKPAIIDWGDGVVENTDGNIVQKTHEYATVGEFTVTVSNIKSFAASANDATWFNETSQNRYTLTKIVFGNAILAISPYAFYYCSKLADAIIPASIANIGSTAFYGCSSLAKVAIPNSVNIIWSSAFYGCTNLTLNFEERTLDEVQALSNYPWGLSASQITAIKMATQNWVEAKNYLISVPSTYKTYANMVSSLSSDGYLTSTDVVTPISSDSAKGKAADAKATGTALYTGFTEWEFGGYSEGVEISDIIYEGGWWRLELDYGGNHYSPDVEGGPDVTELYFIGHYKEPEDTIKATRHLITPTKTSQLTNDGAPNGGGTPYAAKADLPYAMVTPGEWEFSGSGVNSDSEYDMSFNPEQSEWTLNESTDDPETPWIGIETVDGTGSELSVEFGEVTITATRASLPGHLLDRAINIVSLGTGTSLQLPQRIEEGKSRNLLVRMHLSADFTGNVSWIAPANESAIFETEDGIKPFPTTFTSAQNLLFKFTETMYDSSLSTSYWEMSMKQLKEAH